VFNATNNKHLDLFEDDCESASLNGIMVFPVTDQFCERPELSAQMCTGI